MLAGTVRRALSAVAAALVALSIVQVAGAAPITWHAWSGQPAMISNTGVYRGGEFIYQDYIYDDHGANTDGLNRRDLPFGAWPDPSHPGDLRASPTGGSVRYTGDFMYPSADGDHIANIADLIEFRVTADPQKVSYHIRFGDMTAINSNVVAICVDEDFDTNTGLQAWPANAGFAGRLGCDHIIMAHGDGAELWTPTTIGKFLVSAGGAIKTDVAEATMDLQVPRSFADPLNGSWRYYVASGMWDGTTQRWVQVTPGPQAPGSSRPTGGAVGVPQIFDLLSNNNEPNSYWREEKQANDLLQHNILDDYVDVDFSRILSGEVEPDPQRTGVLNRIYISQHPMSPTRGIQISRGLGFNWIYNGKYQPYAMVVPADYYRKGAKPTPFDLCMHPLNGNHMVEIYYSEAFRRQDYNPLTTGTLPSTGYLGFGEFEGLINRLGALYACVLGRGEGVGYQGGNGLVDVLEVQRDVAAHYNVDANRRYAHGVSLGAIGTWYVSELYPDRYAAAMPYIFGPNITNTSNPLFANLYNLPMVYAIGTGDQFAQGAQGDMVADQMIAQGNEFTYVHYLGRQHEGRIGGDVLPFVEKLAYPKRRVENPARVRYLFDASKFSPKERPATGSAYWASGITPRASGTATADVTSLARASQLPSKQVIVDGLYTNTIEGWQARIRGLYRMSEAQFRAMWQPEQWEPGWRALSLTVTETSLTVPGASNGFMLTGTNLGAVTLDTGRMGLDTGSAITGTLSGAGLTTITLAGTFSPGTTALFNGGPVATTITPEGLSVTVTVPASGATLILQ